MKKKTFLKNLPFCMKNNFVKLLIVVQSIKCCDKVLLLTL